MKVLFYMIQVLVAISFVTACSKKARFSVDPNAPKKASTQNPTVIQKKSDNENLYVKLGIPGNNGTDYYEGRIKNNCTKRITHKFRHIDGRLGDLQVVQDPSGQLFVTDYNNHNYVLSRNSYGSYTVTKNAYQCESLLSRIGATFSEYTRNISEYANSIDYSYQSGRDSYEVVDTYEKQTSSSCKKTYQTTGRKCGDVWLENPSGCNQNYSCMKRCRVSCGKVVCRPASWTTNDDYTYEEDKTWQEKIEGFDFLNN